MRAFALAVLCVTLSLTAAARQSGLAAKLVLSPQAEGGSRSSWEGSYLFQEGEGGHFVEHKIKVYRLGGELVADLDAAGFQTAVSLRCDAKIQGAKLNLYFRSYREENIGEPYRKGQLLLSLETAGAGRRSRLLTSWGAYRPVFRRPKGPGVFFRKT
jgi:hypothetical protein